MKSINSSDYRQLYEEVKRFLQLAAKEHHKAYRETDGFDLNWPMWYAEYLHKQLIKIINASFSKQELSDLLILMDKEYSLNPSETDWASFYTNWLLEKFPLF
jgi:hypothetical protein